MPKKEKNNDVEIVKENYNKNAQLEWERLEGFHFEFEIAKHYLKKYLRGKTVLDIGGGPGRYSVWLAKQGYDVTLVDLSESNIALAKQKFQEYGVQVKAYVCDARDLSALAFRSSIMCSSWGRCIICPMSRTERNAFWKRKNTLQKTAFYLRRLLPLRRD